MWVFRDFLSTSISETLDSKGQYNVSLIKLPEYYYFELLVLKYLKNLWTQTAMGLLKQLIYYWLISAIP